MPPANRPASFITHRTHFIDTPSTQLPVLSTMTSIIPRQAPWSPHPHIATATRHDHTIYDAPHEIHSEDLPSQLPNGASRPCDAPATWLATHRDHNELHCKIPICYRLTVFSLCQYSSVAIKVQISFYVSHTSLVRAHGRQRQMSGGGSGFRSMGNWYNVVRLPTFLFIYFSFQYIIYKTNTNWGVLQQSELINHQTWRF